MLLSLVYFVKVIHKREVIVISAESAQCLGTIFSLNFVQIKYNDYYI